MVAKEKTGTSIGGCCVKDAESAIKTNISFGESERRSLEKTPEPSMRTQTRSHSVRDVPSGITARKGDKINTINTHSAVALTVQAAKQHGLPKKLTILHRNKTYGPGWRKGEEK